MERAVEVAVLAAVSWPLLRVGVCPAFWRRLGASPEIAIALVGAFMAYVLFVGGVAYLAPGLLRSLAVMAAIVVLAASWRARPHYGRARGLPTGSLALAPREPWTDDQYYTKQAARYRLFTLRSLYLTDIVPGRAPHAPGRPNLRQGARRALRLDGGLRRTQGV